MLLCRLEREGQLLVLGDGLGQLPLGLEQLLLEGLDPARALLEAPAEDGDLLLGGLDPKAEGFDVLLVVGPRSPTTGSRLVEVSRF